MSTENISDLEALRREWRKAKSAERKAWDAYQKARHEQARRGLKKLPPHQRLVLGQLTGSGGDSDGYAVYRRSIQSATGLDRAQVGRALGALRRYGFVDYVRGLLTEGGETAGSGYVITDAGTRWFYDVECPELRDDAA